MIGPIRPELAELQIADPPERWQALGFIVDDRNRMTLGGIEVQLGARGHGITAWSIRGIEPSTKDIDGLATRPPHPTPPEPPFSTAHPNGATGIDHVVITTPDFDRTKAALANAHLPLRRIRDAGTFRQGFRRLGPAILELVESRPDTSGATPDVARGPAQFWGLVVIVTDLDALTESLDPHLSAPKPAVQPGRRIATLRSAAGLSPKVAFMDPEKRPPEAP